MLRKLGFLVVVGTALVLPASAAEPGSISGYVRSTSGVPQMGAIVEVLGSAIRGLTLFTDEKGFYRANGLLPGTYRVKVSAPSFLPAWRERVGLRAGANVRLNLTLNTLFDAIQMHPSGTPADEDDWKWVLRSVANRPVLRMFEEDPATTPRTSDARDLKGKLAFFAGGPASGSGNDMSTGFSVEKSLFSTGTVALVGNVGYGEQSPAAVLRASYRHRLSNGSEPLVAFTMRRLPSPDPGFRNGTLQALELTTADNVVLGDILELRFGSQLQTIQFMGRVTAFRPFGSLHFHISPNTVVEYRYATTQPDNRLDKGFDSAPADLSESGPHVSLAHFSPTIERSHHQEIAVSRRAGKNNLQFAVYADQVADPALAGVGEVSALSGETLPGLYSGTFTYRGSELDTHGVRLVFERQISSNLTATMDYEYGGVLDLGKDSTLLESARDSMTVKERHSIAGKLTGTLPRSKTRWIASYRWVNGQALTPVDMFNASAGQTDPYLGFFVRQPIPGTGFLPGHFDALVDVRNLLAQGYVPLVGNDGRTVYLVQSARTVRGGVAFTF